MDNDDFCVYKENGNVKALGWDINSNMLCNDFPLAACCQSNNGKGDDMNKLENLAIPAGLILLKNSIDSNTHIKDLIDEPQTIGQDLYARLLELAQPSSSRATIGGSKQHIKKKKRITHNTRKKRGKTRNKTKKLR